MPTATALAPIKGMKPRRNTATRPLRQFQPAIAYAATHLDEDLSLSALAADAGMSPFHWHRGFTSISGETPKRLTLRLRLTRAAALLLTSEQSVLDIALTCGFRSPEVFSRAFRKSFDLTPSAYRKRGFATAVDASQAQQHAALVDQIAPCVNLYHFSPKERLKPGRTSRKDMAYTITKQELAPQPVVVVRKRVKRSEIATAIGEGLPHVFVYAQQKGIPLAGLPFCRYPEMGMGMVTLEPGMFVAASGAAIEIDPAWTKTAGEGEVRADTLPGGPAAFVMHVGPYDTLPEAYAALEQWIADQGLTAAGAPWECYRTDPGEVPDPKDWKTEIFWPVR
jgi:AraC family transcriptional regulator